MRIGVSGQALLLVRLILGGLPVRYEGLGRFVLQRLRPIHVRVIFGGPAGPDGFPGAQANVSKHLALLHAAGLVSRKKDGTRTVYAIADPTLKKICSIVCRDVEREALETADAVLGVPRRRR
jgi:DNA-binding transcriptional ArsR family regulator